MKTNKLAHKQVAEAAKQWAGAWYEEAAGNNDFYHNVLQPQYRSQEHFILQCWAQFIPVARAALAASLNDPNLPEKQKHEIYDALLLDKTLPRPGHFLEPYLADLPKRVGVALGQHQLAQVMELTSDMRH